MTATPPAGQERRREFFLLLWAGTATAAAVMFAVLALFLFLRTRETPGNKTLPQPHGTVTGQNTAPKGPATFANVREEDIPGRYKFFEAGVELGMMTLNQDHTFINKDGTTFKQYRWDITPEGLILVWQRSTTRFAILERAGVYIAPAAGGKEQRLEKIE
jgi:hypothetical protein